MMETTPPDSVPASSEIARPEEEPAVEEIRREANPVVKAAKVVGPGVITGASDDDPSGIATYTSTGASLGYPILWMALITLPMMAAVQFISAKVGLHTGMGLARVLRTNYPKYVVMPTVLALFVANTINAGADIGAIAAAINLLAPIPIWSMVIPIGIALAVLQVFASFKLIQSVFKWLALSLLAYIGAAIFAHPDASSVLRGTFVPTIRFNREFIAAMVAILGTTISPYLFFWQASLEAEETPNNGKAASDTAVKYAAWDVNAGMLLSNAVMYFIILATAATLFAAHKDVNSATDAAAALQPIVGSGAKILLAIGLIGAGLLAVPVLTASAAYAITEMWDWRRGLDHKPGNARGFYGIIVLAIGVGLIINFVGLNPIDALFFTAVLNGLLAPPVLLLLMLVSNNPRVMDSRTNGPALNVLGWLTTLAMTAAAIALFVTI